MTARRKPQGPERLIRRARAALPFAEPSERLKIETLAEDARWVLLGLRPIIYCPHLPHEKQVAALQEETREELLFGGAARGGKTDYLLMEALRYADRPGYSGLLLRRTFPELTQPDGIIPRLHEWLGPRLPPGSWSESRKEWRFPSGAVLRIGSLDDERAKTAYQGGAYQFVGFDELTHFPENFYLYLFSRLTRLEGVDIPLRMRAASNPGGPGHSWVKKRFIGDLNGTPAQVPDSFVPSRLEDNPFQDQEKYRVMLSRLDSITRRQLELGDWTAEREGGAFKRSWFRFVPVARTFPLLCRGWDLAASVPSDSYPDPSWTAGAKVGFDPASGEAILLHVALDRLTPAGVEGLVLACAATDGFDCRVRIPQDPGQSGLDQAAHYAGLLAGYDVGFPKPTGEKSLRWTRVQAAAENGLLLVLDGPWVAQAVDHLEGAGAGGHTDLADALALAYNELTGSPRAEVYGGTHRGVAPQVIRHATMRAGAGAKNRILRRRT